MPKRHFIRWVLIPGLSLGALVLSAALAAWLTRPAPAPAPTPPAQEAPPPTREPLTPPPHLKPPTVAAPPAFPSPPSAVPGLAGAPSWDTRRLEDADLVIEDASGRIDRADIRVAVRAVSPLVQQCFEDVAQRNPGPQEVKLRFTVQGSGEAGQLTHGELLSSTIADPMVQACVLDSLLDAQFSAPSGGGKATVVYPFRFRTPGEAGP
ncbi:AgmX/PglI C-terminal domain-containing protein [Myxococcaceae bacterium JPH2]|nr:AgmX/PglI C-terminal domain-containing protein [Myxococcaceae bacterium JPH2]